MLRLQSEEVISSDYLFLQKNSIKVNYMESHLFTLKRLLEKF